LGGALVEETALVARWLAAPGVRIVRTDGPDGDAGTGYTTPIGAAGRYAQWAATARSARLAAAQQQNSELEAEPHPTREQLFGRTRVDGLGGPRQTGLPRRHPLGVAG
jgi:DNA polymerase-3 subunit epsilon